MTAAGPSHDIPATPLASDFDAATREAWMALVDKAIKGADFEKKLVARTADGLRIEPIYARDGSRPALQSALPGHAPLTRGARDVVQGLGWEIRQGIGAADPGQANTQILGELDAGSNGIVLEVEAPGQAGCQIRSAADMAAALSGMRLDLAPLALKAGLAAPNAARQLLAALSGLKTSAASAQLFLGLDPIGSLARWGTLPQPVERALLSAGRTRFACCRSRPRSESRTISRGARHETSKSFCRKSPGSGASSIRWAGPGTSRP
jgi:methylmalonyl-CoA mutase